MTTTHKNALTIFAFLTAVVFMSGCGSKSNSRASSEGGLGVVGTNGSYAVCNGFDSTQARLGGRVQVYYSGNTLVEDKVRLRVTTLDSSFDTNSNLNLKFYRWRVNDSNGVAELDQTPITFLVENSSGQAISSSMTSINTSVVSTIRQNAPNTGATSSEFFNRTSFQITGVDYNWDALKVALYNGPTLIGEANMLLPAFLANPNTYGASHPALLNSLHPFMNDRTNGYTDQQWVQLSQNNCF